MKKHFNKIMITLCIFMLGSFINVKAGGYTLGCGQKTTTLKGEVYAYHPVRTTIATSGTFKGSSGKLCVYVTGVNSEVQQCANSSSPRVVAQMAQSFTLPHTHSFIAY